MPRPSRLHADIARRKTVALRTVVHRITRPSADPLLPSTSGGRWAPAAADGPSVPVLYTSFARDGALAEVASYLSLLTPLPGKPLASHVLDVTLERVVRLDWDDLGRPGVDRASFGMREYGRTQGIGAEVAAQGHDGLVVPSARWSCENLVVFTANMQHGARLAVQGTDMVDWQAFARENGLL